MQRKTLILCLSLIVLTAVLYWPVGHLGYISYDDPDYIINNQAVHAGITLETIEWAFTTSHAANWHPVTWLSHALDCQLFGNNPGAFHLENLAIHIANAVLLFLILQRMTRATWRSVMVAALFAWHPMHIQSVAWISERKDMLSGFFMLLTLGLYVRHAEEAKGQKPKAKIFFCASVGTFAVGLMSKSMLVTLPAILLLLDFWPLKRFSESEKKTSPGPAWKRLLWEKIPFLLLSMGSVAATLLAHDAEGSIISGNALPLSVRLENVCVSYTVYLEKLFWPENLSIFYPYQVVSFWEEAGCFLLLGLLSVFCFRRVRHQPWWLAGWLWFLVMLLPVIGLIQAGSQSMADRYTYLPSIGIFIIVAWSLGEIAFISRRWLAGVALGSAIALAACLSDARLQLKYWHDDISLTRHGLEVAGKNNFSCYFGLGGALMAQGDIDGAITNFQASLQAAANYPWPVEVAAIHHNLGCALLVTDRAAEAEAQFRAALQQKPNDAFACKYLGDALADQGKISDAEIQYATATQLLPNNPVMAHQIETSETLAMLSAVAATNSTAELHVKIGDLLADAGKFRDAANHFRAALELAPDAPQILNNLAWTLATCSDQKVRDGAEAVKAAQHACEVTGWNETIYIGTLAAAYAEAGSFDEAVATAQKACDLAAKNGEADLLQTNRQLLKLYQMHKTARE